MLKQLCKYADIATLIVVFPSPLPFASLQGVFYKRRDVSLDLTPPTRVRIARDMVFKRNFNLMGLAIVDRLVVCAERFRECLFVFVI